MPEMVKVEILQTVVAVVEVGVPAGAQYVEVTEIAQQGIPGPPGTGAITVINFAWGDATPKLLVTVVANKRVYRVRLWIETPFNGTGAALTVGSVADPDELIAATENDPTSEGVYETYPDKRYLASTPVSLTITPGAGASAGAGQVHLEIEP